MAPDAPQVVQLVSRVEKLEKQNRRFKQLGLGVSLALGTVLVMGQARPQTTPRTTSPASSQTLEAEKLILRDAQGRIRVQIDATTGPSLEMYDPNGNVMATFAVLPEGSTLSLNNADTKSTALFEALAGGPTIHLDRPNGQLAAALVAAANDTGLQLSGTDGEPLVTLESRTDGQYLSLIGPDRKSAGGLGVSVSGPSLSMSWPLGGGSVDLNDASDGPVLRLTDRNGFWSNLGVGELISPSTGETHKTSAASLALFDKQNHVIWQAP